MKIHVFVTTLVIVAGLFLKISRLDWLFIIILIGLVLSAEMVNTALEEISDLIRDDLGLVYETTKRARDVAAGAVLVLAIVAAVLGCMIFYPYLV